MKCTRLSLYITSSFNTLENLFFESILFYLTYWSLRITSSFKIHLKGFLCVSFHLTRWYFIYRILFQCICKSFFGGFSSLRLKATYWPLSITSSFSTFEKKISSIFPFSFYPLISHTSHPLSINLEIFSLVVFLQWRLFQAFFTTES